MHEAFHAITGAPLTDDADPSVTPPTSAARRFRTESGQDHAIVQLVDGTSCTATAWSYLSGAWVEAHAGQGNEANLVAGVPGKIAVDSGALTFIRLTSIVGSPTVAVAMPAREAQVFLSLLAASSKGSAALVAALASLGTTVAAVSTSVEKYPNESETVDISAADHTFTLAVDWLWVSGGGTLIYRLAGDSGDFTITVLSNTLIPGKFSKIEKTGTTCTGMVGLKNG